MPTGIDHGTVTIVANGKPFEVTTLRQDVETDGRHANVAFTKDWAGDAARRDFTMNAIYADASGTIFDPVGGVADADARRVRFIGDPIARIREDYLRILRFFRFTPGTARAISMPRGLPRAGGEGRAQATLGRARAEELLRLLEAREPLPSLRAMADTGILAEVLAEAGNFDALTAVVIVEADYLHTADPIRRLAVFVDADDAGTAAVAETSQAFERGEGASGAHPFRRRLAAITEHHRRRAAPASLPRRDSGD